MSALPLSFDATINRNGSFLQRFGGVSADPLVKAKFLRDCLRVCQPGWTDVVDLGPGGFDVSPITRDSPGIVWPNEVTIRGMGRKATYLYGTIESDTQGAMFTVQNNEISNLTMEAIAAFTQGPTMKVQSDPRTLGFDFRGNVTKSSALLATPPYRTRITDCDIKGPAWTVYSWSPNNTLILDRCDIYSGRICVGALNSGDGQDFSLYGCRLFGDPTGIFSVGAISQVKARSGVFGVVMMGGTLKVIDCEMNLIGMADLLDPDGGGGWSRTRRVCGITDMFGYAGAGPAGNTKIEVANLRCSVTPNGSDPAQCYDLDFQTDYVRKAARVNWPACLGSAADGTLSKSF